MINKHSSTKPKSFSEKWKWMVFAKVFYNYFDRCDSWTEWFEQSNETSRWYCVHNLIGGFALGPIGIVTIDITLEWIPSALGHWWNSRRPTTGYVYIVRDARVYRKEKIERPQQEKRAFCLCNNKDFLSESVINKHCEVKIRHSSACLLRDVNASKQWACKVVARQDGRRFDLCLSKHHIKH